MIVITHYSHDNIFISSSKRYSHDYGLHDIVIASEKG